MASARAFNILSFLIAAWIFALQAVAQTISEPELSDADGDEKATVTRSRRHRLAKGAIAGIAIGAIVLLILAALCCFCTLRLLTRRRSTRAGAGPVGRGPPMGTV